MDAHNELVLSNDYTIPYDSFFVYETKQQLQFNQPP